jgi:hypothetical protein
MKGTGTDNWVECLQLQDQKEMGARINTVPAVAATINGAESMPA